MNLIEAAAHWAWDTSLAASVLLIPALIFSMFFRRPAFTPIRHMLGLLIVARLLLPFSLSSPASVFNLIQPQPAPVTISAARPAAAPIAAVEVTNRTLPARDKQSLVTAVATTIWVFGIGILLVPVAIQHIRVRRWMTPLNRITSGPPIEALMDALDAFNYRRAVAIYSVPELPSPALFGLFRPAILLPANLDKKRLRSVCLHEIAHLRRKDVLINWLMISAQTLHWFNPLVWISFRRLRADQELLCDEDVMRMLRPDERQSYGETLLALASPRSQAFSTLIPVSSNFKQLKERIGMIKCFQPVTRRFLVFALPLLAALLLIFTFTAATEKKLSPSAKSAKKTNTPMSQAGKTIEGLEMQFAMENDRVRAMEARVDELRKQLKVFAATEADLLKESDTIRRIEQDRTRAEHEFVQFKQLLSELKKKDRHELTHTIPTAYRDESLLRLLELQQKSEQQRVSIKLDYTDDHPEVRRLEEVLRLLSKQIDDRVKGVINGLETIVASRKAIVDQLNKQLAEIKIEESDLLERARPYFTAKRDLETHQKFRDAIYLRLLEQKADQAINR